MGSHRAGACDVYGFIFCSDVCTGRYGGWGGFDENSDANLAGVEQFSSPCFFQHTFELCIVTLVSGVGYEKVVTTEGRKSFNSK